MCLDSDLQLELEQWEIETDWLVIKINETEYHDLLGSTEHHPRRAIAFKYPTKQVSTEIIWVTYQIGRTWVITPVAELQPVQLGGVLVSRATLHNFDMIAERDIRLHDSVWIQRSGEVIPYVIGPIVDVRTGSEEKIQIPTSCPSCNALLVRDEWNVAVRCPSPNCDAKRKWQLNHFVSKKAANISWFGQWMIDIFYDAWLLKDIASIYWLMTENSTLQLRSLPWVGVKKIAQLQKEIEKAKNLQLWRFLHGLSISYVGIKAAKLLENFVRSQSIESTINLLEVRKLLQNTDELLEIHGLGDQTVNAIVEYMSSSNSEELFAELEELGVKCLLPEIKDTTGGLLVWMVIVITWSFAFSRAEFQKLLEQEWARVTSSVTKKTSLLIAWETPWSKLQKATELHIPVMSFDQFEQKYSRFSELKNSSSWYQESSLFG